MIELVYNEIAKIVAQRRFVVVAVFMVIVAILSALVNRGINNAQPESFRTASEVVSGCLTGGMAQLIFPFLFSIIIGDIVAGELSAGTMKLLLIRPVSRWKIWLSKLIGAFLVSAFLVALWDLCYYIALGAAVGFGSWSAPDTLNNLTDTTASVTLRVYGLEMISVFAVVSLLMFISTLVENGVAAVSLCSFVTIVCAMTVPIMKALIQIMPRTKWVEYLFFEHWQISGHIIGNFPIDNWSITGSIIVLAVWTTLFIAAGITVFQMKDVKG